MREDEKKMLEEIDSLHSKLLNETQDQWNGSYFVKPNGNTYCSNADLLLKNVLQLKSEMNPDYLTESDIREFEHTYEEEVHDVKFQYSEAIKKDTSKSLYGEFIKCINRANQKIELDLFSLFEKIEDMNND